MVVAVLLFHFLYFSFFGVRSLVSYSLPLQFCGGIFWGILFIFRVAESDDPVCG